MLKLMLDKPFNEQDIAHAIEQKKQEIKSINLRNFKIGILLTSIGAILVYFKSIDYNHMNDKELLKLIFYYFFFIISTSLIFMPSILQHFGIYELHYAPFKPASKEILHDCEAFVSMPSMQQYQEYVVNVRHQGRELTQLECEAIVQQWKSLAK
jgi:hypothetical protein